MKNINYLVIVSVLIILVVSSCSNQKNFKIINDEGDCIMEFTSEESNNGPWRHLYFHGEVACFPDHNVYQCLNGELNRMSVGEGVTSKATCLNEDRIWKHEWEKGDKCCCNGDKCYLKGNEDTLGNQCIKDFKVMDCIVDEEDEEGFPGTGGG